MALKKISDYLFCSRLPRLSSYCLCRSVLVIPETKKNLSSWYKLKKLDNVWETCLTNRVGEYIKGCTGRIKKDGVFRLVQERETRKTVRVHRRIRTLDLLTIEPLWLIGEQIWMSKVQFLMHTEFFLSHVLGMKKKHLSIKEELSLYAFHEKSNEYYCHCGS